jgi:hypothetical protein
MNAQDERKTEELRRYVNSPQIPEIRDVEETDVYIYFNTNNIQHVMTLKLIGYDTWIQETKDHYRVRVLKPNWFTHDLTIE